MARYIDADKVMEEIARIGGHNLCEWDTIGVKALIDRQPTADVAPRAEVEKEIEGCFMQMVDEAENVIADAILEENRGAARIAEYGRDVLLLARNTLIETLKKKYTEGEK